VLLGNPIGSGGNDADGLPADFAGMRAPLGAVAAFAQKLLGGFAEFSFTGFYWYRHKLSIRCILLGIKIIDFGFVLISSKNGRENLKRRGTSQLLEGNRAIADLGRCPSP
jgi:hypothetical protein